MRISAKMWNVALVALAGVSGASVADDRFSSSLSSALNPANQTTISMQLVPSSATRNVGIPGVPADLQAVRGPDAFRNVDPSRDVGKPVNSPRVHRMDRHDRLDKTDTSTTESGPKSDASRNDAKIAANTADDSSSQQPAAPKNTPPPPA